MNTVYFGLVRILAILAIPTLAAAEPSLFQSQLRISPDEEQIATIPHFENQWTFAPFIAKRLDSILASHQFPTEFIQAASLALTLDNRTGKGTILADENLLHLIPENKRERWWSILASHHANPTYRWPLAIDPSQLATIAKNPTYSEPLAKIQEYGVTKNGYLYFADLFLLEKIIPPAATRNSLLKQLLSSEATLAKLDFSDTPTSESQLAYWNSGPQNHSLAPLFRAVQTIEDHDRIDSFHVLPRSARDLLFSFPKDLVNVREPAIENALFTSAFWLSNYYEILLPETGFSPWLAQHCQEVEGPKRYGDIIVYEDPGKTKWPYSVLYLADDIAFGRPPNALSPWLSMRLETIGLRNLRFSETSPRVFRMKKALTPPQLATTHPIRQKKKPQLRNLPAGPWGRLAAYDVLLLPSENLLANLPRPSANSEPILQELTLEIPHISSTEQLLDALQLDDHTASVFQTLATPSETGLLINDYQAFYNAFDNEPDRTAAFKAAYHTPAIILLMQRPLPSEVEALTDYWSLGQKKSVRQFLASVSDSPEIEYIDIAHLLPPRVRGLLNTYSWSDPRDPSPSCFWTAINFAQARPDPRLLVSNQTAMHEIPVLLEILKSDFQPNQNSPRFGDLILYRGQATDDLKHACNYIADDIVFTKNGVDGTNPWCLMRLADLDAIYLRKGIHRESYTPLASESDSVSLN